MDRDPLVNESSNEYLPNLSLLPYNLQCVLAGRSCFVIWANTNLNPFRTS